MDIQSNSHCRAPGALVGVGAILGLALAFYAIAAGIVKAREYHTIGAAPVQRTLTVSGTGKMRAAPDLAMLSAGVQLKASLASEAQTKANEKMATVLAALRRVGIADKDLQTSNYSVNPRYDYFSDKPRLVGYEASQQVEVRIRDLDHVDAVLDALRMSDATNVSALQFTIDDPETLRAEVRKEAIADARARAQAIADALGVRLGSATRFNDSAGGFSPPIFMEHAMGSGGAPDEKADIQTGENEIRVDVTVTYTME